MCAYKIRTKKVIVEEHGTPRPARKNPHKKKSIVYSEQCKKCKFWTGYHNCRAFPEGIPKLIASGGYDHTQTFRNDRGFRFTPDTD